MNDINPSASVVNPEREIRSGFRPQREEFPILFRQRFARAPLDLPILRTLQRGAMQGHAIAKAIEFRSDGVLQVEQGSLYPVAPVVQAGWISAEDGT